MQENGLRNSFLCVNTLRRTSSNENCSKKWWTYSTQNVCYLQTKRRVFCGRCQKVNTVNGNTQKIHWEKSFQLLPSNFGRFATFSSQLPAGSLGWTILKHAVWNGSGNVCGIAWTLKGLWLEIKHWNELLLRLTGKTGSLALEFGGGICCRSVPDICRWWAREVDLYELRLLAIMPNRPVRDKSDYLRKMERHFPIKPRQPIGIALATFYHFRIP